MRFTALHCGSCSDVKGQSVPESGANHREVISPLVLRLVFSTTSQTWPLGLNAYRNESLDVVSDLLRDQPFKALRQVLKINSKRNR